MLVKPVAALKFIKAIIIKERQRKAEVNKDGLLEQNSCS
jgi:hypothetical protein